jgi:integrase
MKSPRYLEIGNTASGQSFLFVKRISANKGTFPTHHDTFPERFKRRLGTTPAMTMHEAGAIAQKRSIDIEHLQSISMRDKAGRTNTTKDLVSAAKTWLWFNEIEDLSDIRSQSTRSTAEGESAANTLTILTDAVKAFYRVEGEGYSHKTIFTPFGDHLLGVLNSGQAGNLFSEAVPLWAKQTNRSHLKPTDKPIHDATRFIEAFNEFAGDRPIDQITRSNVTAYITHRCKTVKTTSVDREIHTLRAVWNRAADALDISSRNPFERQSIHGLGTDAIRRPTPSAEEHQSLMQLLGSHPRKKQSYVIPMLAVISLTGLRLSEAWGIQAKDWDSVSGQLLIRPNELRGLKTDHSERPFPVLPELAAWLDLYLSAKRPSSANAASATTGSFMKSHGFDLTAHCLRHGFKQRLVEVDTPSTLIEELMGWSDQSMMRHYGLNAITTKKRRAVQLVYAQIGTIDDTNSDSQGSVISNVKSLQFKPPETPLGRVKTASKGVDFPNQWHLQSDGNGATETPLKPLETTAEHGVSPYKSAA